MQLAPTWRRRRDLNPRAGIPTYTLSRGAPSAKLGYFSTCRNCYSLRWRRERDSNPRCLSASLVFKTSSINHSDISPYEPEMPIYYSRASFACQGQTVALPQYAACLLRHVRGIGMDCGGRFCPSPASALHTEPFRCIIRNAALRKRSTGITKNASPNTIPSSRGVSPAVRNRVPP